MSDTRYNAMVGCLLGGALGDAIGLPREGLSRDRACRMYGSGPLEHRFFLGRGMVSDDTEHALMTAQALLASGSDVIRFKKSLAWRLRGWLLGAPAGVGFATLRALLKLWIGFGPDRSGVCSAGNGPCMRAPILGVCLGHDPERLRAFVRASTRITHTDARAEEGAWLIASAAHRAATSADPGKILEELWSDVKASEWTESLDRVRWAIMRQMSPGDFADYMGWKSGVSGYIVPTVSASLFSWLSHPRDFRAAIETAVALGGDTDTVGAIVGGIVGAGVGQERLPKSWLDDLFEWPRTPRWIETLASRLTDCPPVTGPKPAGRPVPLFWPGVIPRNLFFLCIVLCHGFRRLLPPY